MSKCLPWLNETTLLGVIWGRSRASEFIICCRFLVVIIFLLRVGIFFVLTYEKQAEHCFASTDSRNLKNCRSYILPLNRELINRGVWMFLANKLCRNLTRIMQNETDKF